MKGNAKPFTFSYLPKVSRAHITLSRIFPKNAVDITQVNELLFGTLKDLEPISAEHLRLALKSFELEPKEKTLSLLDEASVCALGVLSGKKLPFAIVVNERSVIDLVYSLMGTSADTSADRTSITPVEEGIFSFILAAVFNNLQGYLAGTLESSVHLASLDRTSNVNDLFFDHSQCINFSFDLEVDGLCTKMNILLAAPSIISLLQDLPKADEKRQQALSLGLSRVAHMQKEASVVIGQLSLEPEQLDSLQIDDIVLLESPHVGIDENNVLVGEATCHVAAQLENIRGQLSLSSLGKYSLQISSISNPERP